MIYVPNYTNTKCAVVVNSETIRVYERRPQNNTTISYIDYYIRSDYLYTSGTHTFSQYTTLPTCINSNQITTNFLYRVDFANIMIIFMSIVVLCYFLAFKPISRLFGRWLKI